VGGGKVPGDGEAETEAAEAHGDGGVALLEGPEQVRHDVALDADARVGDLHPQHHHPFQLLGLPNRDGRPNADIALGRVCARSHRSR
jgi:hypothetical protein